MIRRCVGVPIGCGREIPDDEYQTWDSISQREHALSGWCRGCQYEVFGRDPWDDIDWEDDD